MNREEYQRADALSELAPHLPEALMSEALATALSIRDELHRTDALCELVPYLSEVLKAQAISETLAIGDKSIRAKALSELISNLSVDQQLAIIQDILPDLACSHVLPSLKRGMTRTASLHTVITYWQSMQFEGFIPQTHWLPVLRALSSNSRRELQYDLTALLPLIEHVGGQAAILEMLQALRDVAAWWP